MSINKDKLNQIDNEINEGKITKAISRLEGLIWSNPDEQIYRDKLGEVYYSVNWLEKAGQFWYLTKRNASKEKAIKIFEDSCGNSATQILTVLKFNGSIDNLQEEVKHIYINLENESLKRNGYIPKFYPKSRKTKYAHSENDKLFQIGCIVVIVILIILTVIGLFSVIKWII